MLKKLTEACERLFRPVELTRFSPVAKGEPEGLTEKTRDWGA